jgi:hypothetical protein
MFYYEEGTLPESGAFTRIWEYEGKLWTRDYLWEDGVLKTYNPQLDLFEEIDQDWFIEEQHSFTNYHYLIINKEAA